MIIERSGDPKHGMVNVRISRGVGFTLARVPEDILPQVRARLPGFDLTTLSETKKAYLAKVGCILPEMEYRDEVIGEALDTVISQIYAEQNQDRQPTFDGSL